MNVGGGTFDVTLMSIDDGVFEVKSTAGDTHLGGEDFDACIMRWCQDDIKRRFGVELTSADARQMRRLRTACEKAKRQLSSTTTAQIEVEGLTSELDYVATLSRAMFNKLCDGLFRKTLSQVDRALRDGKAAKRDVDEIVLVGGSTRIIRVQEMLSEFFGGKKLNHSVHPDEVVAHGACIQAAIITKQDSSRLTDMILLDVTPLSLGVETAGGVMTHIIERNHTIPCKKTRQFSTHADNQTAVLVQVYEGERGFVKENNKLGEFLLGGIPPAPRNAAQINVTFNLDVNGIMTVSAEEAGTARKSQITIANDKKRLSSDDISRMVSEAEQHREQDRIAVEKVDAINDLEQYCYHVQTAADRMSENRNISPDELDDVTTIVNGVFAWLEVHSETSTADEVRDQREGVREVCEPIMVRGTQGFEEEGGPEEEEGGPRVSHQ